MKTCEMCGSCDAEQEAISALNLKQVKGSTLNSSLEVQISKKILMSSLVGQPCQSLSTGLGTCVPLTYCSLYPEVTEALLNGQPPPYYFDALHDKMACGFPDGRNTLICCANVPEEVPPLNIPAPPNCGTQGIESTKILGGDPVLIPGTYPWLAEIGYEYTYPGIPPGTIEWRCAGSLITALHILTVAHCTDLKFHKMLKARMGAINLDDVEDFYWQERFITQIIPHEEYDKRFVTNDVAILVLETEVELTKFVHPICLPYTQTLRTETFENKHPVVAGWGHIRSYGGRLNKQLFQLQLPVWTNSNCTSLYRESFRWYQITDEHICAGEIDGIHDTSLGDSGTPLALPIGNFYYAIGSLSSGASRCAGEEPSINVRITKFIDWIVNTINK